MPTPETVMRAMRLLAEGISASQPGMGELLALDMGGATTDVYSCARGRSGASDRGERAAGTVRQTHGRSRHRPPRHTIGFLAEQIDIPALAAEADLRSRNCAPGSKIFSAQPDRLPATPPEMAADTRWPAPAAALPPAGMPGRLEETYTPAGRVYLQEGKDLGSVPLIIGTGRRW